MTMAEDVTMAEPEDSLVSRRSRRSTAGNRMEAALAEMALDSTERDVEDDNDFINDKDEEDVFESDFESTDEEAAKEDEEAGEKAVHDEERRVKKAARSKLDKVTAAAHAKHKATFNPKAQASVATSKPRELRRRVSLGVAVDAETGEVVALGKGSPAKKKRHSQRKHTILSTSAHVKRMKRSEEKKAAAPKKVRTESRSYTQAELIARALDNEEGNLVEHRDYLKIEEEKRKRARVVRSTVEGPLLRWVSKGEDIKIIVPPPLPPPPVSSFAHYSRPGGQAYYYNPLTAPSGSASYGQGSGSYPYAMGPPGMQIPPPGTYAGVLTYTPAVPTPNANAAPPMTPTDSRSATPTLAAPPSTSAAVAPSSIPSSIEPSTSQTQPVASQQSQPQQLFLPTNYISYSLQATEATASTDAGPSVSKLSHPQATERTERVTKNLVVHELSQYEGVPKPPWTDTMTAMFGDHVKWDELRVYVGKSRPLSRPKQICPLTGRLARYLDPRTGVPYADVRAYEVLTGILNHDFIWSPGLGCYVGKEEVGGRTAAVTSRLQ